MNRNSIIYKRIFPLFGFIHFICGCGAENYNLEDILCHFRARGFRRGMKLLLNTRIVFSKRMFVA